MMRAMPLEFPEDLETHNLLYQYMLGPSLLVGAFTKRVYLPAGGWYNYWTGEQHSGPGWVQPTIPEDRGGPLLVRAGAIIPRGEHDEYVECIPQDVLILHLFAGAQGEFTLYEDDGQSFDFEQGGYRTTRISQRPTPDGLQLEIAPAQGDYPGAPTSREITVWFYGCERPEGLAADEWSPFGESGMWRWEEEARATHVYLDRHEVSAPFSLLLPRGVAC